MKKFVNRPEHFVDEMLQGLLAAHPGRLSSVDGDLRCVVRKHRKEGKVAIATGGGSGHLPLFVGYVGDGMVDGCAVGGVFQSPSAEQMHRVTRAVDAGRGVLYLYGNYSGDRINFGMAAELAEMDGIEVQTILGADDVASAPKAESGKRRGVAGLVLLYKIAGAMSDTGADLAEVCRVTRKAGERVATIGVALSPCIIPEVGKATFSIGEGEMEIGMGIHGEPGIRRGKLRPVDDVVAEMMESATADIGLARGDEAVVMVNGLGATCREELYLAFRKAAEILEAAGIRCAMPYIGEYATSLEMMGFSISLLKLDAELRRLVLAAADTPFFVQNPQA